LDWIGLDWVEILEKNDGLDWIGSKVLCIKIVTAIFVRPIILILIILNYLSFSKKSLRSFSFSFFVVTDDMTA